VNRTNGEGFVLHFHLQVAKGGPVSGAEIAPWGRRTTLKRFGLILIAIALLVLAGWCVSRSGGQPRSSGPHGGTDPLSTAAGWRYRQNQPHHWRYIMLQH
jgi:hypothetical protein